MAETVRSPRGAAKRRAREVIQNPGHNESESPLGWLYRRKDKDGSPLISQIQFDAGERLRADFTFAQMSPRVTVNWSAEPGGQGRRSAPGMGVDIQDHVMAAAERVRMALKSVGPELSGILIDVCCHLKGLEQVERALNWPQRSARIVLGKALDVLARHYGLDRPATSRTQRATIRHWGAEGYRPVIEAKE